jgi:hypothetical protein
MIRLAFAVVVAGCGAPCETIDSQGPGVTATLHYTTADGDTTAPITGGGARMTARDAFTIHRAFTDVWGDDRTFDLALPGLVPDGEPHDPTGELCTARQTHAEPVCAPLTGMVTVRRLASDCYEHESGIGACAETIDATVHVVSDWQDTHFTLDGDVLRLERWVATECED